ncbi:MAG: hypothetical protein ACAI44_21925 [Candidatus Sericytochromatia bacterium]
MVSPLFQPVKPLPQAEGKAPEAAGLNNISKLVQYLTKQEPQEQSWQLERLGRELQALNPEQRAQHRQELETVMKSTRQLLKRQSDPAVKQSLQAQLQTGLNLINLFQHVNQPNPPQSRPAGPPQFQNCQQGSALSEVNFD